MTKALFGIMAAALAGIFAISAAVISRDHGEPIQDGAANPESLSQVQANHGRDQTPDLAKPVPPSEPAAEPGERRASAPTGTAALEQAAAADRYLFVFFYGDEDEQTRQMREVFDAATRQLADRADAAAVKVADPREREIVDKFNVSRAPMPLIMAVAPNGAVTGGFSAGVDLDEEKLRSVLASPSMEKCLKSLQDGKLVLLCAQNTRTDSNDAAMVGVRDFKADSRFAEATEIVTVDPGDPSEAETLQKLRIDPNTPQATTILLAPPGRIIGTFKGATHKDLLVTAIQRAMSSCSPGSGCCPPR